MRAAWLTAILMVLPAVAHADGETAMEMPPPPPPPKIGKERNAISITMRVGGYVRSDREYLAHAEAFGFKSFGSAILGLDVGWEVLPRLSIHGSFTDAFGTASRNRTSLRLSSSAILGHVRYAFFRNWLHLRQGEFAMWQLQASVGGGAYTLTETWTDGTNEYVPQAYRRRKTGAGARFGLDASIYYRSFGLMLGYAYDWAPVSLEDKLGGSVAGGGHEITFGLGVRF